MQKAPLPYNESERLASLYKYHILDTVSDEVFQFIVDQAAMLCEAPIALINLIDKDRGWFYAKTGIDETEISRDISFCAHAILQTDSFIITDASTDKRFYDHPFVTRNPSIRFYAGVPLITPDGCAIGTLCILDYNPRVPKQEQICRLKKLRDEVVDQLEYYYNFDQLLISHQYQAFLEISPDATIIVNNAGRILYTNHKAEALFGYTWKELIGCEIEILLPERLREKHAKYRQQYFENPRPRPMGSVNMEFPCLRKDGTTFPAEISLNPVATESSNLFTVCAIRDVSSRVSDQRALIRISKETFSRTGEDFFPVLAKILAQELGADYVTIGKLVDHDDQIETITVVDHGSIAENFTYALENTPCAAVIEHSICTIRNYLQQEYPDDSLIKDMGMVAYVGARLYDSQGITCGVINALFCEPLNVERAGHAEFLLQIFALRAASELERAVLTDALQQSEHSFRKLFDNSPFGMVILDHHGRILKSNRAMTDISGYSSEELQSMEITELHHPDTLPTAGWLIKELANNGNSGSGYQHEFRYLRKDGQTVYVNKYGYRIDDMHTGSPCIVLHVKDITEYKKRSEEIHKLSLAIKHSPNVCLITDKNARIEYVNSRFTEVTGYSSEEVIGKTPAILASGQTPREAYAGLWATILSGKEWRGELYNKRKNGELYWARQVIFPVMDEAGEIRHFVSFHEDGTEARKYEEKLSYQATHDQLTGLINRYEFERRLERTINMARTDGSTHVLCFLDLDQFKIINDTSGHVAGDALLRQLGELLRNKMRQRDTVARLGGDEFGILMEHCPLDKAQNIATMLCTELSSFNFVWENRAHHIGVSIGITAINRDTHNTIEVMKQADTACYAAKDSGRNRVHIYNEEDKILSQRLHETNWVPEINAALMENRFELVAQPIMRLNTNETGNAYEILIRLKDASGNLILPGLFLPSAERYNLSLRIDRWVIDRVFQWLIDHPEKSARIDSLAVNLSGASISDRDLLRHIVERFESSGLLPSKIRFELTETSAIANMLEAKNFMGKLRDIGFQVALDDFGSGLSSFAYLKHLPVNMLKIDGMFVKDIVHDKSDYAMVGMINELAHALGMETVAEYVENDLILEKLRKIGVDYVQGYAIAEPMEMGKIN
jgi:diguanylate cyclase (GGDEF)-like protein/PAS domain S-box-containing protein